jgi:hypothetical protein
MDTECHSNGTIAGVGQIHPKTNREAPAHFVGETRRGAGLSAPRMARQLPQILSTRNLEIDRRGNRFCTLDRDA